jgi:hypothetical protein
LNPIAAKYKRYAYLKDRRKEVTMEAIRNVFELVLHDHPECAKINPLSLWNLHYLRALEG